MGPPALCVTRTDALVVLAKSLNDTLALFILTSQHLGTEGQLSALESSGTWPYPAEATQQMGFRKGQCVC